jgi:MOSC domain-containing protein YiiM
MTPALTIREMIERNAQPGRIMWIGLRPERRAPMQVVTRAELSLVGLVGDRRTRPGKRSVTLVQWEHLAVIAAFLGRDGVPPELLRRNIAVAGINLIGLRDRAFSIGGAVLRGSGLCAPCRRMEEALGPGGYAAVRMHGGITAEVITCGAIALGDAVWPVSDRT